jgi:hypothetical protein
MKIIYRSILREITDAKEAADRNCRTIESIELSRSEGRELVRELSPYVFPAPLPEGFMVVGIPITITKVPLGAFAGVSLKEKYCG